MQILLIRFFKTFLEKSEGNTCNQERNETLNYTYIQVPEKETEQKIFLTAEKSLERLVKVVENHAKVCDGSLNCKKVNEKGNVATVRFNCSSNKSHSLLWFSSHYLPNNEYLVNRRVMHGFACRFAWFYTPKKIETSVYRSCTLKLKRNIGKVLRWPYGER